MRIVVAGASGLVGAHAVRVAARRGHETIALVGSWTDPVPRAARTVALDVADPAAVQRVILDLFPDAIVNAAAISELPACEANPARAHAVNVGLPQTLAQLAHHLHARLLHLSTEQVFDGTRAPYSPDAAVAPLTLYGRQKAEAEGLVARFAPETSTIVRLPLLGGNSLRGNRSLHERLFAAWAAGGRTRLFRDEIRQPCSAENVAEMLVELTERTDCRGIVHWAGAQPLSRLEMGERIAAHFRLPAGQLIVPAARADDPAAAWRQPDLTLDCRLLSGRLKTRLETFPEMLEKLAVPPACRAWYRELPGDQ